MSQTEGTERILSKMAAWAAARDDLRAIAVVGSRARADHAADRWSDLDVVIMARRPKRYLTGIFIAGDAEHATQNTGSQLLRLLYVFPSDSFAEINYEYPTA